jgi:hypothetical protein
MTRLIIFALATASMFISGTCLEAQTPPAAPSQSDKATGSSQADEISTAIDVVALIMGGSGDADIAKSLSTQRGFDRESALNKGATDEQIIRYLIIHRNPAESIIDNNKFIVRKAEGDKHHNQKQYDKAAKEYTLAAKYSPVKYEPYKLRADAYKQYLLAELSLAPESSPEKARQELIDKSRMHLCNAIYSDYAKARSLNDKALQDTLVELNVIRNRMGSPEGPYDTKLNVDPTYRKTAQYKLDMIKMRPLENQIRAYKHNDRGITEAMSDYKSICGKEDAARRQFVRTEQDSNRDKKWIKYGEKDETSLFYDKSGITTSKEYLTVPTRHEKLYDEKAYDTASVRVNCKLSTVGILDRMSYDEIGKLTSESHDKNAIDRKVTQGSVEEMLLREVCKR